MAGTDSVISEGWYLMSVADLELELEQWRNPERDLPPSNAARLAVEDALAFRDAGNLPDELGRSLRLVLEVHRPEDLSYLQSKRLEYEPDFHDAPDWKRDGSRPVNVVPLRAPEVAGKHGDSWLEDDELAALEDEWRRTGAVSGLKVPDEYRGFVYKTVLALREAGKEVSADSVADSISRWLSTEESERIRRALHAVNG